MSVTLDPLDKEFTAEELAVLKVLANKPEKKWWADYPFLVSLLAFLLSLATSLISAYVSHQRDIHDEQSQLAMALANLQDLNLKQIELHEKYKDTPYERQAAGLINNELNSTLQTAAGLGLRLGANATTAELTAIAQGLYGLGDYATVEKLFKYSLDAAETAGDRSVTLRDLGFYKIRHGGGNSASVKEGDRYYQQAFEVDKAYDLAEQPYMVAWFRAEALLGWAEASAPIDCPAAQKRFKDAIPILLDAPATMDLDQSRAEARQQWLGIGGVPSCLPTADTVMLPPPGVPAAPPAPLPAKAQ